VNLWLELGAALVLAGLVVASVTDLRVREVSDRLWQVLGVAGALLGLAALAPGGGVPIALWLLVSAMVLQHVFPWDELLGERSGRLADALEFAFYVAVFLVVGFSYILVGIGPSGVPIAVVGVLVTVVFARVLFETGVLFGGADAKAVMIVGILVPFSPALLGLPTAAAEGAGLLPFAVNVLMNAALLSVVVPIAVAVRNVRRGEFDGLRGFSTYTIPVDELPDHYVWVRDPAYPNAREEEAEVETSEEDRAWRQRVAAKLKGAGLTRVRVSPQLPFLVLLAAGAVAAFLAGNLILDALAAL
jgi:hypothetical protein